MEAEPGNFGPQKLRPALSGVGVPLFHAAWLFSLGVVVAEFIELRPTYLLIALFPVAILCGMAALRAQRIAWLPLAALWCLLGAWCAEMQPQPAPAPALAALSDGLVRNVEGTITDAGPVRGETEQNVDEAQSTAPTQRLDLRISSVEVVTDDVDAQAIRCLGACALTVRWPDGQRDIAGFHCGQRIRAVARLMQPEVYRDPGAWNRRDYLLDQGITSTATVSANHVFGGSGDRRRNAIWSAVSRHGSMRRVRAFWLSSCDDAKDAATTATERRRCDHAGGNGNGRPHLPDTCAAGVGFEANRVRSTCSLFPACTLPLLPD